MDTALAENQLLRLLSTQDDSYYQDVFNTIFDTFVSALYIRLFKWISIATWRNLPPLNVIVENVIVMFKGLHIYLFETIIRLYTEHQWEVTTDLRTLNIGAHLDLSGQRIAVCSAFIFVVYSAMNRYYRKRCASHMNARYPFTNVSLEFYGNLPNGGGSWKSEPRSLYLME